MFSKFSVVLFSFFAMFLSFSANAEFKKGDKLQTLSNLHPDINKRLLYTLNYQLQDLVIPVCSDITVKKISKKKMVFMWEGQQFTMVYEGHTKKTGYKFKDYIKNFFGAKCDKKALASLSELDKAGVKSGSAKVGMTKKGVQFAMGRPPVHANPSLESSTWMYWMNRFKKRAIEFDEKGIVSSIRN